MENRRLAIITGISLILMAVVAGFSFGYAYSEFYNLEQLNGLKSHILNRQDLYRNMLAGIGFILFLDLIVSFTLYQYFKRDNKRISLIAGLVRIIYTLIFAIATYFLIKNTSTNNLTNELINLNFQKFQTVWNGGLVIFGIHILLIGWLMKLHQKIHKFLWGLTIIAGLCYIIVHLLKLTSFDGSVLKNLEMILALPMAAGELGLAIWLLLKGGKYLRTI